jgi:hypothetical protein
VVREGLEPVGSASEISNLLVNHVLMSPSIPSKPRIWHSIWHWTPAIAGDNVRLSGLSQESLIINLDQESVSRREYRAIRPNRT